MEKTYEQLLEENRALKAQLKLIGKVPRKQFVFPEELGKKYFSPDYELYNTELKNRGRFIDAGDINRLSLIIRTVLFKTVKKVGKTNVPVEYAKNINDLTESEYETYVSCLDDFMGALKKHLNTGGTDGNKDKET